MFASGSHMHMRGLALSHTHRYATCKKKNRKREQKSFYKWVILMCVGNQVPVISLSKMRKMKWNFIHRENVMWTALLKLKKKILVLKVPVVVSLCAIRDSAVPFWGPELAQRPLGQAAECRYLLASLCSFCCSFLFLLRQSQYVAWAGLEREILLSPASLVLRWQTCVFDYFLKLSKSFSLVHKISCFLNLS